MIKKIEKKTTPELFEKILSGEKNFEVRLADWQCRAGDILVLREYDPKLKKYSGRKIEKTVGYVLKTKDLKFFSQSQIAKYGWQIIGFK